MKSLVFTICSNNYLAQAIYQEGGTEWADYYDDTNYTPPALADKGARVAEFIARCAPGIVSWCRVK